MTDDSVTTAIVRTDRPGRYGKQLVSHLGRRHGGEWSPESGTGWIDLDTGRATVTAAEGALHLRIDSDDIDELARLEDVIARHLVRFGERDELTVTWERSAG
ncbi:DUF2218 domain-containing protein [Rhodococcus sp. D2-41]|uniref:DUF2218 domain-containing protein n=1 Tax=Speluncibacter jeojiensis TaxID=2710754 RepID=UPI00240F58F9|nr:DUF2218 domain-containing protein [Rhodococcus sp. D2-41]MDG3010236.1 DUF2218 domain-containing protein [Rhodococcus sp. D2-41]